MGLSWLKVREDLHEDPAVLRMASQLKTRPEHVVGYCIRFWAWVSRNCHGGSVTGVTLLSVETVLNLPGFCDMLVTCGWLEYSEASGEPVITIPKYDRHLSEGAKERALAAERKANERKRKGENVTEMSRSKRDNSVTREEKRRVKKERKKESDLSDGMEFVVQRVPELANGKSLWRIAADPSGMIDALGAITPETVQTSRNLTDWFSRQSTAQRPAIEPTARGLCVALACGMAARDRARDKPAGLFAKIVRGRKWGDVAEYLPRAVAEVRAMMDAGTVRLRKDDHDG